MEYVPLADRVFKINDPVVLDINKDGRYDFLFYTELFSEASNEYAEYRVVPQIESAIAVSAAVPKVFNENEVIGQSNAGATWTDDPVVIAKRIEETNPANIYWEGACKEAENKYLGTQLTKDGKVHQCWIRISIVKEKGWLILHDAAIGKEPGKDIIAGKTS